jgi:hypothetical protein
VADAPGRLRWRDAPAVRRPDGAQAARGDPLAGPVAVRAAVGYGRARRARRLTSGAAVTATAVRAHDSRSDLDEVAVEKTVALLDRARNEPRDLYGLWFLTANNHVRPSGLVDPLKRKLEFRGLTSASRRRWPSFPSSTRSIATSSGRSPSRHRQAVRELPRASRGSPWQATRGEPGRRLQDPYRMLAALAISNTMSMSVLERTGEIGVMRAMGMTRPRALGLFLVESVRRPGAHRQRRR